MTTATDLTPAPAAPRFVRDRFPLVPCTRCGGSGTYSRCQTWGTTCFKCGVKAGLPGTGLMLATKAVATVYGEWEDAKRAASEVNAEDAHVGDVIAVDPRTLQPCSGFFGDRRVWATLTAIDYTAGTIERNGGYSIAPDGTPCRFIGRVTYTVEARDGRTATFTDRPAGSWDRKATVDPAPYAVRAWGTLTTRQRKLVINPEAEAAQAALVAA